MDKSKEIMRLVGGPEFWTLRKNTAIEVTELFKTLGATFASSNDTDDDREKAIQTMGTLLQMCGELGVASSKMLSGKEHYAGAALLRQIVEIEYLTWTFEKNKSDIQTWLGASDKDRMKTFSPAQLRKNSKGRFLQADYKNHCEMGGHPVPKGIPLLGGESIGQAQFFIVDLLLHCWRTWDQVKAWLKNNNYIIPDKATEISGRFGYWGENDPLYKYMCKVDPETDPSRNVK